MPVRKITDAGLNRAGFNELSHGLPHVFGLDLNDSVCFGRFLQKCDDHRLPLVPPDMMERSGSAFFEHTFDC